LSLADDALKRAQSNAAKTSLGPPLQITKHRLQSGTTVGDFYVKEISRNTITLEAADGFQPNPFSGQ
jgi:hypothetical protein